MWCFAVSRRVNIRASQQEQAAVVVERERRIAEYRKGFQIRCQNRLPVRRDSIGIAIKHENSAVGHRRVTIESLTEPTARPVCLVSKAAISIPRIEEPKC